MLAHCAAWQKIFEKVRGKTGRKVGVAPRSALHAQSAAAGMHTARVIDAGDTTVHLPATAALRELWQVELGTVRRLSRGGAGFTAVHYAAAALKLLDSQQARNTVGLQDMEELLGRYVEGATSEEDASAAGAAVLERMVQAKALSVRPPSSWARDIPVQAFGDSESLVTAFSTMDLYCMRRIRPQLERVLERHDSVRKAKQVSPLKICRVIEGHTVAAERSGASLPPP